MYKANALTFVSQQLLDVTERIPEYNKLLFHKEVEIVPMGVDLDKFSSRYRITDYFNQLGKKVILFVGRLVEYKGLRFLIEAMKDVDALLVVVGSGPMEEEYKKLAFPIREKVQFLGSKTHKELKTIYASADIFCIPSYTTDSGEKEGFGLVVLEAMASGLPVVASDCGGIPTMVKNGYNGLLITQKSSVSISDSLNKLIYDKKQRQFLSDNALITAKEFSYKNIGETYAKLISNIIDEEN